MGGKILPFPKAQHRKAQSSSAQTAREDAGKDDVDAPKSNVTAIPTHNVPEEIKRLQNEHLRLSKSQRLVNGPTSYETTRIYNFVEVVEQFNLPDSPLVRLISSQPAGALPKAAVVHFEQMPSNPETREVSPRLVGRTLFIPHHHFEAWITRDPLNSPETDILQLLTGYLLSGSSKVN